MSKASHAFLIVCVALASSAVSAQTSVDILVTPLGGSFRYEVTIGNAGTDDLALVSLIDAPLGDPLIDPTLIAPAGFLASYDSGLGFVDFLEDSNSFAAGTSVGGFRFESLAGPTYFTMFEALTILGTPEAGSTTITVIPEPSTLILAACGLLALIGSRRWAHR